MIKSCNVHTRFIKLLYCERFKYFIVIKIDRFSFSMHFSNLNLIAVYGSNLYITISLDTYVWFPSYSHLYLHYVLAYVL